MEIKKILTVPAEIVFYVCVRSEFIILIYAFFRCAASYSFVDRFECNLL